MESRVKQAQATVIKQKYRYFLRKYQKLVQQHAHYKEIFEGIEGSIEESLQIQQENSSIAFIKKLMEETEKNHNKLQKNIDELRLQKDKTMDKMAVLKDQLMGLKREYFEVQRQRQHRRKLEKAIQQENKQNQITCNMFKIRLEKKQICKQIKTIEVKAVNKEKAHAEVLK